jgi:GAF domain-containing protein
MPCSLCHQENPTSHKFCRECGTPLVHLEGGAQPALSYGDVHRSLAEALEQQTATSEILRVISQSPTEVQPVFDTIVRSAVVLCGAMYGTAVRFDGELMHLVAGYNYTPEVARLLHEAFPMRPSPRMMAGRAILSRDVVQVEDALEDSDYAEGVARAGGFRSMLAAPMLRDGRPIGAIVVNRGQAGSFSRSQIALLQTFADQAVIAIENVRLFTELNEKNQALTDAHAQVTEALEQQTATADILRVISRSPTDVQPVFDAVAESARQLCNGEYCVVESFDRERLHFGASDGLSAEGLAAFRQSLPRPVSEDNAAGRAVLRRMVAQIPDVLEDPAHGVRDVALAANYRSVVAVPMLRDGQPIGAIVVARSAVGFFPERQVALLQTFADQAVIAIENVRLFNETREALEQQTATSEILRVISSSPTDVQPVFDVIVRSAVVLCGGVFAAAFQFDGQQLHLAAHHNLPDFANVFPMPADRQHVTGRAVLERTIIHVPDVFDAPDFGRSRELAHVAGFRSTLAAPMLHDGKPIGAITVGRAEGTPFTDSQVALLRTFADQAVIAIENVRLFTELQEKNRALTEALDQQTATSDILRVISRSQTDIQPVFDTIVASAIRLCGARMGAVHRYDGELVHLAVLHNFPPEAVEVLRSMYPRPPQPDQASGRAILTRAVAQIEDMPADSQYTREVTDAGRWRSILAVPMLRDGVPIGAIVITRSEAGRFADTQIELLKTFADQAVIAVENVRLFTELQEKNRALTQAHAQVSEALEQQTATSDILRVISSSPTDVQPVYDSIVERAARLCGAEVSLVARLEGEWIHVGAVYGTSVAGTDAVRRTYPMRPGAAGTTARAIRDSAITHIPDVLSDEEFTIRDAALAAGFRAVLAVPMLRGGRAIGAIAIGRAEAGGFSTEQVNLLRTFAEQAIIAIENVRLFKELEARSEDLTRSVGELRALGEVGQAISSTLDLQTALGMIVARATQLSGTDAGVIYEYDETREVFVPRATEHLEDEIVDTMLATPVRKGEGATGKLAEEQRPVQVPDIVAAPVESRVRGALVRAGYRALLAVPLVRDDHLLGGLTVIRKATGAFAPEVVDLLRTFATQSALAIQNARLFHEIADKSRQLEAASRHKSEFLASMSHELRTPLNGILGFNEMILGEIYGEVPPDLREPLTEIQASGRHLLRLINNVLDLSKIEAGRMELALADYVVSDVVEQVRASLHPLAADKGLEFVTVVPADLPLAHGDAGRITQCLTNLAGNALKFTREGRVEIAAEVRGKTLVYRVSDTGIGIAPDRIETLFTEFRQADPTIASEFGGSGLGLSITRKFAEMHGGRVWVESEPGRGSTFFLALPLRVEGGAPK